ncbi:MAG: AAA family ATPase [Planctomycetes bacterium]|nr:AAA family ATPase [Planctomycetota bacterium]
MRIRDIQIDGFGVWSGLAVDSMPDGMTVFYGPNEAGKTTLMNFLRTMFYGFTSERRQRYLPPVHGGKPGGAIRVTGPGGGYEIARRATLNDPTVAGQLTVTSSDGITQGQHRLTSLLGNVDESIFTNVFAIGLRELQELSTLDDTAAADELYKLSSGLDRVSLVDVIRQLRASRAQLAAANDDHAQMPNLLMRREKLRDEIEQHTLRGRRWGELAAHRRNQQNEIDELKQRIAQWEVEAKSIEVSLQVREPWFHREQLRNQLTQLHARVDLPDDAMKNLGDIQVQIDDKKRQIQSLVDQRRAVRKRADDLPVNKNILALSSKIDAAAEQGPWISQLQKQIQRLESELRQTQDQLIEDAKRLGLSEPDLQALLSDKRVTNLPELSRGAITQLAGPARDVRMHQMQLKQARQQIENDRKEAERLHAEIGEFLAVRNADDLQEAIRNASERIQAIRKYQQVEERLDKLVKHREELEGDSVDLESDDGFSWERVLMLAIPFFIGAFLFLSGLNNFFGWYNGNSMPAATRMLQAPNNDPQNTGVLMTVLGLIVLVATYLWWKSMERGIAGDITECESQLEALMSQVRKTEQEKKDLSQALPDHGGSMEQLLREAEHDLGSCEALLPVYHNEQAARQRMQSAKRQGAHALSGLKSARSQWQKTLQQIGLADSLSPKSIRILAEGYESLSQTRKRFKAQNDELSQRKIELNSAVQKLDALSTQVHVALTESNKGKETIPSIKVAALSSPVATHTIEAPQQRLQELVNTLAQHQQFLAQRRELKNEDEELGKKQKLLRRLMERNIRARQSMLADLAVETPQQLEEHLAKKNDHLRLETEISNLDDRIKGLIGLHVAYDAVARMLGNSSASELEKRWETLGSRISGAEERIGQLLQRQGEISQEMKTLAADRRLAEAKLELSCLERQIDLCAAHWRTLGVTTCMLEKVCEVYETERQPETLREASTFLKQLTDGKYVRVWTPLGKNALRIDNERGQSLPLEVLSRGTREAVFIALRLSLAAAYSRRGVTLPLVLDDVLVNFDSARATHAAKVLRDFAALGHQVIMFTCHEHIMRMFHSIDVQVRVLPDQGVPGEARVYNPGYVPVVPATKPMQPVPVAETPVLEPAPQVVSVHPVVLVDLPADPPPIVPIKPRRQPAKRPRIVEEPIEAGMWFDDDISDVAQTLAEGSESAELKLWTEIEELTQPFDGAPHDAWWEAHQN